MRELPLHPVALLRPVAFANGKQREEPLGRPGVEVFGAVGSLIEGHGGVNGGHHRAQSTHATRARTVPDAAHDGNTGNVMLLTGTRDAGDDSSTRRADVETPLSRYSQVGPL